MEANCYEFTAIRGVQASAAYFVIMVPLKLVPRLFRFDDEAIPAQLRAQRTLNRARVPAIARYITDHPTEYILSSLCACIDGEMSFDPAGEEGALRSVGKLKIGMSATILINDGQHRRAAIEDAIKERPQLGDETISVVVFADQGLQRSQQMFADLNMHAVRPTASIRLLYNHRDALARLSREVIHAIPLFRDFTDFEHTSISNRSLKLFTLSSIHQATAELIGKSKAGQITDEDRAIAIQFWVAVIENMPDWRRVQSRDVASAELRRDYVHAHGVAVQAIASTGHRLMAVYPQDWEQRLLGLTNVDWSRANTSLWEGRALIGGKVNRSKNNVVLVANVICEAVGVALSDEGQVLERAIRGLPAVAAKVA